MAQQTQNKFDCMRPDPNWDERYEAIVAHGFKGIVEFIHAKPLGNHLFKVMHQPHDTPGLFYGDVVRAKKRTYGLPEIFEIEQPSNFDARILSGLELTDDGLNLFNRLNELGVCEAANDTDFCMSAPKANWRAIEKLAKQNRLTLKPFWWQRINHIPKRYPE